MWTPDDVDYNDFSVAYTFCENDSSSPTTIYVKGKRHSDELNSFLKHNRKKQECKDMQKKRDRF